MTCVDAIHHPKFAPIVRNCSGPNLFRAQSVPSPNCSTPKQFHDSERCLTLSRKAHYQSQPPPRDLKKSHACPCGGKPAEMSGLFIWFMPSAGQVARLDRPPIDGAARAGLREHTPTVEPGFQRTDRRLRRCRIRRRQSCSPGRSEVESHRFRSDNRSAGAGNHREPIKTKIPHPRRLRVVRASCTTAYYRIVPTFEGYQSTLQNSGSNVLCSNCTALRLPSGSLV